MTRESGWSNGQINNEPSIEHAILSQGLKSKESNSNYERSSLQYSPSNNKDDEEEEEEESSDTEMSYGGIFLSEENEGSGAGLDYGEVKQFHTIRSSSNNTVFD